MKIFKTPLFLTVSIVLLFSACNLNMFNGIYGNKEVEIADRTIIENFSKIKVSTGLELYITQGIKQQITIEADDNLHEIIVTKIENGTLKIYSEKNIWNAKAKKIHVTVDNLTSIIANSGAAIKSETVLNVNSLQVVATSGANIEVEVNGATIISTATSGANLKLKGTTSLHKTNATSGASIKAFNLKSDYVKANVTSGADITIYATKDLDARATSGGDIEYKGNPEKINKNASSGGSIAED